MFSLYLLLTELCLEGGDPLTAEELEEKERLLEEVSRVYVVDYAYIIVLFTWTCLLARVGIFFLE